MSKCTSCRKDEAVATWWEKKRYKLMFKLFGEDTNNLTQEKYTQGFGDGYKKGFWAAMNQNKTKEEVFEEMIKEGDSWLVEKV